MNTVLLALRLERKARAKERSGNGGWRNRNFLSSFDSCRFDGVENEKSIDTCPYTQTFPLPFVRDPESRVFHDSARARNDSHTVIHDRAKVPRCSHSKKPYTRRGLGNRARTCIPTRITRIEEERNRVEKNQESESPMKNYGR